MKKTILALSAALLFSAELAAQRAMIYKNLFNYIQNNRSDWTIGYRMPGGNYFTVGIENWHFNEPALFAGSDTGPGFGFGSVTTTISVGRRINIGVWHLYDRRKGRRWHFYDHFFGQVGYQYHETITVSSFPGLPGFTSTRFDRLRCVGIGVENGYVYGHKKLFLGPAITNGFVAYLDRDGGSVDARGLTNFNKGMYIWLPMVRFVAGFRW